MVLERLGCSSGSIAQERIKTKIGTVLLMMEAIDGLTNCSPQNKAAHGIPNNKMPSQNEYQVNFLSIRLGLFLYLAYSQRMAQLKKMRRHAAINGGNISSEYRMAIKEKPQKTVRRKKRNKFTVISLYYNHL